jgi:hypothetical protein
MLPTGPNKVSQAQGMIPASEVAGAAPITNVAHASVSINRMAGRLISGNPLRLEVD